MTKEDLVSNFFNTTSKFNKNHREIEDSKTSPNSQSTSQQNGVTTNTSHSSNGYAHPFVQRPLPLQMALFNQQASLESQLPTATPYGPGLIRFYSRPQYHYSSDSRDVEGERRSGGSSVISKENSRNGSDYGGSEVGTSSYLSVSPTPRPDYVEPESVSGNVSPQNFDTRSYASTFSFRSTTSSIRSKAEIKAYDGIYNTKSGCNEDQREPEDCTLPKGDSSDQQNSPGSQGETSPRGMDSPSSMDSNTPPSGSSPTPCEQNTDSKEADDKEDLRKPWKKRKRLQAESDPENFAEKKLKEESSEVTQSSEQQEPVQCEEK